MDDFINQVQHEETCPTCTSEKAITAEIILRHTQMSTHSSLSSSPNILCLSLFSPRYLLFLVLEPVELHYMFMFDMIGQWA